MTAAEVLGVCTLCAFAAAAGGFCVGKIVGEREEADGRASPASYPKGSCSEQINACLRSGGQMDFHQFRLHDESDAPTCKRLVEVPLR